MKYKLYFLLLTCIAFFIFTPFLSQSASYDLYVDKNYEEDDSDGSSNKPYKSIQKAIDESESGENKIYIKNGKYTENITLNKGQELYGQDKSKTIIEGTGAHSVITAKDKNLLKNLTVQKGSTAVTAQGEIKITNCLIQSASKIGIDLPEGGATLTLENSKITKNGKGLYVQKGRKVSISGNDVTENQEEGIDMREKVSGTISDNSIVGNKEGGIEIVVGSSDVFIKNNVIKKNSASGIAAQFYSQASKTGEIKIKGNSITSNGAYGITCKSPAGDDYSKSYWNKSIEIIENKIENNKRKSISGSCKIIEAVTEEEEAQNLKVESPAAKENPEETAEAALAAETAENERRLEEERIRQNQEKEQQLENLSQNFLSSYQTSRSEVNQDLSKIAKENKIKIFFLGSDYKKIKASQASLEKIKQAKNTLEQSLNDLGETENSVKKEEVLNLAKEAEKFIALNETELSKQENKFSLFGWLVRFLNKKTD